MSFCTERLILLLMPQEKHNEFALNAQLRRQWPHDSMPCPWCVGMEWGLGIGYSPPCCRLQELQFQTEIFHPGSNPHLLKTQNKTKKSLNKKKGNKSKHEVRMWQTQNEEVKNRTTESLGSFSKAAHCRALSCPNTATITACFMGKGALKEGQGIFQEDWLFLQGTIVSVILLTHLLHVWVLLVSFQIPYDDAISIGRLTRSDCCFSRPVHNFHSLSTCLLNTLPPRQLKTQGTVRIREL